jgi:hypothetical protein
MVLSFNQPVNQKSAKQLAALAVQLAKISGEMVEFATCFLAHAATDQNDVSTSKNDKTSSSPPEPEQRRKPASKAEVLASVKAARDVIGQHNQPVEISEIFSDVAARGFVINTTKPVMTYGARIRDYRNRVGLIYLQGFGWWLAERPYPPANYSPANVSRIGKHTNIT